jgi:hypothetical protein
MDNFQEGNLAVPGYAVWRMGDVYRRQGMREALFFIYGVAKGAKVQGFKGVRPLYHYTFIPIYQSIPSHNN